MNVKDGYRRRSYRSKTAKNRRLVRFVMYSFVTTAAVSAAFYWVRSTECLERPANESSCTWLKYSSSRQSSHGSATSIGRSSLEMSQHFTNTIFSCNQRRTMDYIK